MRNGLDYELERHCFKNESIVWKIISQMRKSGNSINYQSLIYQPFRWEEKLAEERSRSKEMMARLEREKQLELENMGYRRQVLEKEIQALRKDKERSDETIEELQSQLSKLQTELDDSNELTKQLEKEKRDLRKEFEK